MKGHWIPPSPKGFIDRIAAKLGYSKTIPSGLGTDLVDAVSALNQEKANNRVLAFVEDGDTCTRLNGFPKNQFVLWKGTLYVTDVVITYGSTLSADGGNKNLTECEYGGLNNLVIPKTYTLTGNSTYINDPNNAKVNTLGRLLIISGYIYVKTDAPKDTAIMTTNFIPDSIHYGLFFSANNKTTHGFKLETSGAFIVDESILPQGYWTVMYTGIY